MITTFPLIYLDMRCLLFTVTSKEKSAHTVSSEVQEANASAPVAATVPLHQEAEGSASLIATEAQKPSTQLSRSGSSRTMESAPDGGQGNAGAA